MVCWVREPGNFWKEPARSTLSVLHIDIFVSTHLKNESCMIIYIKFVKKYWYFNNQWDRCANTFIIIWLNEDQWAHRNYMRVYGNETLGGTYNPDPLT